MDLEEEELLLDFPSSFGSNWRLRNTPLAVTFFHPEIRINTPSINASP